MVKRIIALLLLSGSLLMTASCRATQEPPDIEPELSEMKAICELSVMDCYYHNVAKYFEEDADGILWWQKDKRFWIEYGGIVKLGIDASLVNVDVQGEQVTITMPEAKVLSCSVNQDELSQDSYIVARDSAKIKAEDEIRAFRDAQAQLEETASNDAAMLLNAQERAKKLLEDYVKNIGALTGKAYSIQWVYVDNEGNPLQGR